MATGSSDERERVRRLHERRDRLRRYNAELDKWERRLAREDGLEVDENVELAEFLMEWSEEEEQRARRRRRAAKRDPVRAKLDRLNEEDRRLEAHQQESLGYFEDPEAKSGTPNEADMNSELRQLGQRAIDLCIFALWAGEPRERARGRECRVRIGRDAIPTLIDKLRQNATVTVPKGMEDFIFRAPRSHQPDPDPPTLDEQCADVLEDITGQSFGPNVRKWRAWWRRVQKEPEEPME